MFEVLNEWCLRAGDAVLGWMLAFSPSLTLVVVALATSQVMTMLRKYTTNQDLLGRAAADKRRLKRLVCETKERGDREALTRHRATLAQLGFVQLKAEWKPLLAALVPVAFLATWCFQRLEFLPPQAEEPVELVLHTPMKAVDSLVHLVPEDDLTTANWIQRVEAEPSEESSEAQGGMARWQVRAQASPTPYPLKIRAGSRTIEQDLLVGQAMYSPAETVAADGWRVAVNLKPFRPFGFVPGIDLRHTPVLSAIPGLNQIVLAPWLVGYLALVIPLALLLKPLLRIY